MGEHSGAYRDALNFLTNPRIVTLAVVLLLAIVLIGVLGKLLLPFFAAIILAYLLEGGVRWMLRWNNRRGVAVAIVYSSFLIAYLLALVGPLQLALRQGLVLLRNLPEITARLRNLALGLREQAAEILPQVQHERIAGLISERAQEGVQYLLSRTVAGIPELTTWAVHLFLVPLLVFFLLKDKQQLLAGVERLLPKNRELLAEVWVEIEQKISNYVRGKVWEILIVGTVTTGVFFLLGFRYSAILGLLSGISVVIPFVGAIAVALPVFVLGYVQWGFGPDLGWLLVAYVIIQVIDGNLLVPYIFSEAVKLHPLLILLGVVVFGGLWGFWGVFFAIPLATVAKAILYALLDQYERPTTIDPTESATG